jgi:dTDP-4-dehydrorhamnose reductase
MVWLVGNRGLLGREVEGLLRREAAEYIVSDAEVDITDRDALTSFAAHHRESSQNIDWIINCAAYTAVDRAEDEPAAAGRLNALGPKNLARLADDLGAVLVHISTDYVFDGQKAEGYREEDSPGPCSVYGRSKWAGEVAVARFCRRHYILRTAWMFGRYGRSFVTAMLERFEQGKSVQVVDDQWGSPTNAADLAAAIIRLISAQPQAPFGIYHFTNRGVVSWYEFAREIHSQASALGLCPPTSTVSPVSSEAYPSRAARPAYSILHTEKISAALGLQIDPCFEALHRYLSWLIESSQRRMS